jgi:hypothetical protein
MRANLPGRFRDFYRAIFFTLCCWSSLDAQKHPNSPVFKDYQTSPLTSFIEHSDVTYQLWQGFMLVREANGGDALAQHELGIRYLTGRGFAADTTKGAYWIQKAANQHLITARYNFGILLYNGWGVRWEPFEAYRNFHDCAEKKMPEAEFVLGQFYGDNLVVPRNWETAYAWVKKAADAGYEPAREALPDLARRVPKQMLDSSVTAAKGRSRDSTSQSAAQTLGLVFLDFNEDTTSRHADDVTLLKDLLRNGNEDVRNALGLSDTANGKLGVDSTGVQTILKAAEAGSPEALTILGRCYEKGIGVKKNLVLAASTYVRAIRLDSPRASELLWKLFQEKEFADRIVKEATNNYPDAQYAWAGMLALGFNPGMVHPQAQLTEEQALHMLQSAADRNHRQSLIELGLCYYAGRWVHQDRERALDLWRRAVDLGSKEAELRLAVTSVREDQDSSTVRASFAFLSRTAQEGSVLAEVALAYCYENGKGVDENKGRAAKLYRESAQRGSQDAFRSLKRMHDEIRPQEEEFRILN